MPNTKYDPNLFAKHERTNYVFARIFLPGQTPDRCFDAQVVATDDATIRVIVPTNHETDATWHEQNIPASNIIHLHVGAKH